VKSDKSGQIFPKQAAQPGSPDRPNMKVAGVKDRID
jgi:hypothetical protein